LGWKKEAQNELIKATNARQAGNEGRARVCARRAAGHVVGEYFRRHGLPDTVPSAYNRLKALLNLPGLSPATREIAAHFVVRTTPEFVLPVEADLIEEVGILALDLLGETGIE
jgi:hypothetical protein